MSRVYLVQSETGRTFAAKVMQPDGERNYEQLRLRFEQEAKLHPSLSHRNIVRCYEVNSDPPGMLLDYVEGKSIRQMLDDRSILQMKPSQIMRMVQHISDALTYLHERHYCHCDLKPDNILWDSQNDMYYLIDFGISQNTGQIPDTKRGSPKYMAPEQIRREAVDRRTDVYSLATTIYEIITGGEIPFTSRVSEHDVFPGFRRDNSTDFPLQQEARESSERKYSYIKPPPPSYFRKGIKISIDKVLLKALEKEPRQRYETVDALYNALNEAFLGSAGQHTFHGTRMGSSTLPSARLVCTTHGDFPIVTLSVPTVLIGRSRHECFIVLHDMSVSRRHAMVEWDGYRGYFAVWDQGSKMGTRVNGRLLEEECRYLRDGDLITVGNFNFRFEELSI